ncbi:MAG: DUF5106 domain-containing protein [Cytophagales bacterium]|nr:DUF5106 domain-containing protein [Cytophagales bacterium]
MKKSAIITFFLLLGISSFAQQGYRISVHVEGVKDTLTQLAFHFGKKKLLQSKAKFDNKGNVVFEGKEKLKEGIYLVTVPGKGWFEFIAGQDQHFSMNTNIENLVKNMKVTGSDENDRFYEYLNFMNPLGKKIAERSEEIKAIKNPKSKKAEKIRKEVKGYNKRIEDYREDIIKSYPNTFLAILFRAMKDIVVPEMEEISDEKKRNKARYVYYKKHYFDNINLNDGRILRTPIFEGKLEQYIETVVVQMPDSVNAAADDLIRRAGDDYDMFRFLVISITSKYEKSQIMCMSDAIFYHMATTYYTKDSRVDWVNDETMKKIKEQIVKTKYSRCGLSAPNLILADTTGISAPKEQIIKNQKMHSLAAVDAEYTVLYFWSATCGHCKKATPKLYEVYKKLKPHGVEIFTVHIDDNKKALKKYLDEHNFDWIITNAPNNEFNYRVYYNIYSTPVIYLLDKDKKIIAKRLDVHTLDKILSEKLGLEAPKEPKKEEKGHGGHSH